MRMHWALGAAFALACGNAGAEEFREVRGEMEFTGEMIATPLAEANPADVAQALEPYILIEHVPGPNRYVFALAREGSENQTAFALMNTGLFEYVEPNYRLYPLACPNDSSFGSAWHHDANRMNSCAGWNLHTGNRSVIVNICDTGVRRTHEDLQPNRVEGYNAVDRVWERAGGNVDDINSHGSLCTGCAAAAGNNGVGTSGVGWNLRHRMSRVSNAGSGSSNTSWLLHGAEHGIENGCKVSSVSYSGVNQGSIRSSATYIKSLGGLLVWAAGNDGANLNWGNRDNDDLIVVGATDSNDNIAGFSARGPSMDFVAPGVSVFSTDYDSNSDYAFVSGTSFACPLAAGLCALMFSANPSMSPDSVETKIKNGCDDLGSGGEDDTYGHGRIDVFEALDNINNIGDDLIMLVSLKAAGNLGGVSYQANDIVRYGVNGATFAMEFDCSDVLGTASNLDAFAVLDDGSLILSFVDDAVNVPGVGNVNDEDLVQFIPTSLGSNTSGTFAMYFDGSDVSFGDAAKEDIGAVTVDADTGYIYISPKGPWDVGGGLTGKNEDVIEFRPTSLGTNTSGSWVMAFDGNSGGDEGMGKKGEQIDALNYCEMLNEWCFSTGGNFSVPPKKIDGSNNDLLCYLIYSLGASGEGFQVFSLNGDENGFSGADIDGLDIEN